VAVGMPIKLPCGRPMPRCTPELTPADIQVVAAMNSSINNSELSCLGTIPSTLLR
jgi:hypothetical protein